MIKLNDHIVKPTRFPDGTSQVWNLPEGVFRDNDKVTWYFEEEREIIDLLGLNKLMPRAYHLHIPFLPYARQDKPISNQHTFNLCILADILNTLRCNKITAVDVHNPDLTEYLIRNFVNVPVDDILFDLCERTDPDYVVYPDAGARKRYRTSCEQYLVFTKDRDPLTGKILGHSCVDLADYMRDCRFLVQDDICDGGATFLGIARIIKEKVKNPKLCLYVTHGIFSKGRKVLEDVGFKIYTTNSLLRNADGIEV